LRSAPGKGSTFTLYLPQTYVGPSTSIAAAVEGRSDRPFCRCNFRSPEYGTSVEKIPDDRDNLQPGDAIF
jgi:hypothetical protein